MPTWKGSKLPSPSSWDEFEAMVADIVKEHWRAPFANRHGRQGQSQDGVDIYCEPYEFEGKKCGIQCKNTNKISTQEIKEEIYKAEDFEPKLDLYVIATTAQNDAELQTIIRTISNRREEHGKFPIKILMWDDLCRHLSDYQQLLEKYYPQFIVDLDEEPSKLSSENTTPEIRSLSLSDNVFEPGDKMVIKADVVGGNNRVDRIYCRFEHEDGGGAVFDAYREFNPPVDEGTYDVDYVWPENAPNGEYEATWIFSRDEVGNKNNLTDTFADQLKIEVNSPTSDTQGPVIHNFSFSDRRFEKGDTMKIDVNVSDNIGVKRIYFRFEHDDRGGAVFDAYRDFNPSAEDGVHTIEYKWPENAPSGRYDATWIFTKDQIGNTSTWTNAFTEEERSVTVYSKE